MGLWFPYYTKPEMATHSSILAWWIPWTEELGGLQSTGLQRVGHDWVTSLHFINKQTYINMVTFLDKYYQNSHQKVIWLIYSIFMVMYFSLFWVSKYYLRSLNLIYGSPTQSSFHTWKITPWVSAKHQHKSFLVSLPDIASHFPHAPGNINCHKAPTAWI